ncbi:hypothetical protein [Ferruginibacter sp. SUN106]|uniref:hypothetical protein n=1 Tax=Ferruginibacter sp. SUN106 TaxID=2978348 RepID=UPI003D35E939
MKRHSFIKMSALAMLAPLGNDLFARAIPAKSFLSEDDIFKRMVVANDAQVDSLLQTVSVANFNFGRKAGFDFATLTASYCYSGSKHFQNPLIVPKLEILIQELTKFQTEDGTVNVGNLESPPDTAFLLEPLSAAAFLLVKNNANETTNVNLQLKAFIIKAADALATGGVHTPNHRWVICAALARVHKVYPDKKYSNRIEDWLGEGIYMDSDGHYPERSRIYSGVENNSLLTMGRLLNKPSLFEPVRKNLIATYYYMDPNGELVTTDSRRQDQYMTKTIVSYYLHYRFLAIKDNNNNLAGIAKLIEQMNGFEDEVMNRSLFLFLEDELLQQPLPVAVAPPVNYEKYFTTSQLVRIRRDKTTATIFGGADWPIIIASGRSNSPNFYAYRKGNAVLKFMRLSSAFFGMGYFYSEGIKKEGNKYILHKKLMVPYYQPLPKSKRKVNGDYTLSPSIDDRFWNKMDFKARPVSNVKTLDTTITFAENGTTNELTFLVSGLKGVAVTIELCFAEGGKLTGVTEAKDGNSFLENGMGKYESGEDSIQFGPGAVTHKTITNLEGERYSTHFGTLHTKGMYVYITGTTPFTHTLVFS